jgi:hypothetical protein
MATMKERDKVKLAALLGLEYVLKRSPAEISNTSREAESALAYLDNPKAFVSKPCKWCHRDFAHTAGSVAYCSDSCRAAALEDKGIKWDWLKPPEKRWGQAWPLIVPPEALEVIESLPNVAVEPELPPAVSLITEVSSILSLDLLARLKELGIE